ncbi:myb-like DNA-binding domain-containing protein [Hirsutella rhossiliensis]|uniref:Myb-like DNA-binding domain-containing protein n=1 Tax=Hirsutella rhossiliensis TaxID=111463 RepID=A0A9P8MZK5_9HYPO|nr:myb-like DNA-binding domain-containing protein [Hirsutella rhossiliensis]KAH0964155.1 myb-like DNA-binding domain-containing protein [Hirsutella rhossiliensis]
MATIEPRLIHLLNESTTPQVQHADLPPLYALPLPMSSERALPPLEPDASHRNDRYGVDGVTFAASAFAFSLPGDDPSAAHRKDEARWEARYPTGPSAYPVRLLLGESDAAEHSSHAHTHAKILNELPDAPDEAYNKKRARNLHAKDDFVQLPQPMKKQKAAQQTLAMPPIINGLHEPPPHAALFPPIASSNSFSQHDTSQMKLLPDFGRGAEDKSNTSTSSDADKIVYRGRKRATKPRRKWSEEETKHLLLGVNRHGVGKWTTILEDPDFTFNDRTAGDLKDRFRTCCPVELRGPGGAGQPDSPPPPPPPKPREPSQKAKKGIHSENILIEEDESPKETLPKENAKMEDLAVLGIHGPFKKSLRRERRPFTNLDDREILDGLDIYGPAWTKIQRDPRFHLSTRQPTDLRDRVRNKYPGVYQRIEKGTFQAKDEAWGNNTLEPSIVMSIDDSLKRPRPATGGTELPVWSLHTIDSSSYVHAPQSFEFGEASAPHVMGGTSEAWG